MEQAVSNVVTRNREITYSTLKTIKSTDLPVLFICMDLIMVLNHLTGNLT